MNRQSLPAEFRRFPTRWRVVPFTDAFSDETGGQPKIQKREYLPKGTLPIIDQGGAQIAGFTENTGAKCKVTTPCILFGDHTRAFKWVEHPFALGADGVKVLVQCNDLDPRFAYQYLRQLRLPSAGYSRHFKFLKRTFVPLPPLAEQKRIAAILNMADSIRRKRQEAITLTDELLRSVFLDMFGDPVTNPKRWVFKRLDEFGTITTGNTPSRKDSLNYGNQIEWIKTDNITNSAVYLTPAVEYLSAKGRAVGRAVQPGAILMACIAGSLSSIGRVAIVDRPVAFNQQINAIQTDSTVATTFYLYCMLKYGQRLIQAATTGGMKGMVSKGKLSKIKFMAPPLSLQEDFDELFIRHQFISAHFDCAARESENLFNSIVQRAFRGELEAESKSGSSDQNHIQQDEGQAH